MKPTPLPLLTLLATPLAALQAAKPLRPNFVVILGEGHGWSSTSVPMDDAVPASKSTVVRTPYMEKLAAAGMRFANFYAASPRCTPSRATIFTGKSPAQLHMTFIGEGKKDSGANENGRVIPPTASMELPTIETTLAEFLKPTGYAAAHFGKWHVGRVSPSQHGFDESGGATNNGGPDNVANPHPKQLYQMTERSMDFMARQVKAGKPFYLQLSHYDKDAIGPASAILLGDLKLIRAYETGNLTLFNIAKDLGERRDLAQEMPDKAKELNQRLSDYLTAVSAQMPKSNPDYDATKATEPKRGGGKRKQKP